MGPAGPAGPDWGSTGARQPGGGARARRGGAGRRALRLTSLDESETLSHELALAALWPQSDAVGRAGPGRWAFRPASLPRCATPPFRPGLRPLESAATRVAARPAQSDQIGKLILRGVNLFAGMSFAYSRRRRGDLIAPPRRRAPGLSTAPPATLRRATEKARRGAHTSYRPGRDSLR